MIQTYRLLDNYCIPTLKGGLLRRHTSSSLQRSREGKGIALSVLVADYQRVDQEQQSNCLRFTNFHSDSLILLLSTRFGRSLLFDRLLPACLIPAEGEEDLAVVSAVAVWGFGGGLSGGGGSSRSF